MAETFSFTDHSHRRYNILTGNWVLVSPHRTKRPWQGKVEKISTAEKVTYDPNCYLCPGNTRAGGQINPKYESTFAFTNDFSALLPEDFNQSEEDGLLKYKSESGICRVVCFSPDHSLTLPDMTLEDIVKVVELWKEQFEELSQIPSIKNVQVFENKGDTMGCSNPHPHGQIWAQSSVPHEIELRTDTQKKYYDTHGKSLLGEYLTQELKAGERIIAENYHFVVLVPFWAVWPFETMIIPKRHFQNIHHMNTAEMASFADILKTITIKYDRLFDCSFPYSAGMQQSPVDLVEGWHFHYAFYPPLLRSATVKKFMVGYEMFAESQRDITAEQAADRLRAL